MKLDDYRREEAAAWFSAQRRGAMSFDERTRFDAWRADRRNQTALDSMHELWGELSGIKSVAAAPPRRRKMLPFALAASIVLAAVGGLTLLSSGGYLFAPSVYTAVGEQRVTTLPDGSVVNLNVVTRIDYRVNAERRDVKLGDGEALFFVHKDAARPFIVHAGDYEVRAVGTAFNMRRRDGGLQVEVLEGTVLVKALTGAESGREIAHLTAGQKISLTEGRRGASAHADIEHVPVQAMAEWRLRTVAYENASVAEVVEDLNRFFSRRLEVTDPSLANRRVTLRLQVEDRERTLQTLSALLGVKIRGGTDADIITDAI